ncbi:tripartite tricarboxylate transporter substrate binding protein [Lacisediminimonas sp.]|uniref:Bug family tripartite tricarboxylate transporter substrate binding protein n=1 Tax=Lacisediminimonas sp. TaxID=3060582 RepID=UPI00271ED521|nr:tripartite tricarboxylate transporter substrate-binding protein [Lacisediminimonas sp.]MDO8298643.1 tripartite tricarboxylate transporter substrate-binding protein [Lacisediminimonas sp.]
MKRLSFFGAALASLLALAPAAGNAQAYPNKPIKLIVGYPPGGNLDIIARVVGQRLSEQIGQAVLIENKPGADARIASQYVAASPADGYTLLVGATGQMVYNPALHSTLGYDPVKDFVPITLLGSTPLLFAVNAKSPINSVKDLIAAAQAKPGELFYSWGATPFYAAGELFKTMAKVQLSNVPYKGNVGAVNAALAGDVAVVVADVPTTLSQIQGGKLRPIAITGAERTKYLPDTPTMIESGINFHSVSWTGLFAPAGTPPAVIDKLYATLAAILKSDGMKEQLARVSFDSTGSGMPSAEFGAMHQRELTRWTRTLKELNIRAN